MATNNAAERSFAVAKAYLNIYASMKLPNLAKFFLSMCNGSHRMAGPQGKKAHTKNRAVEGAGMAITADSRLQEVVTKLCTVCRSKYGRDKLVTNPDQFQSYLR